MTDDITVNEALIHALAGLGEPAGVEDQENLWLGGDEHERRRVVEARARHPRSRGEALAQGLRDRHAEVRERALELILEGPREDVEGLAECLEDRSQEVRTLAQEVFLWVSPAPGGALPALASLLAHPERAVRQRARHAIRRGGCQSGAELKPVLELLVHPEPEVRNGALQALSYPNRVPEVLEALLARLDEPDPPSRQTLSRALGGCGDQERLREELRRRVAGGVHEVAVVAVEAMAWMADRELRMELEELVTQALDGRMGCAAVLGLELMGAVESIPLLRTVLGPSGGEEDYDEGAVDS